MRFRRRGNKFPRARHGHTTRRGAGKARFGEVASSAGPSRAPVKRVEAAAERLETDAREARACAPWAKHHRLLHILDQEAVAHDAHAALDVSGSVPREAAPRRRWHGHDELRRSGRTEQTEGESGLRGTQRWDDAAVRNRDVQS